MIDDSPIREAAAALNALNLDYAFIHEAACALFGVSYYGSVFEVDVLVPSHVFSRLAHHLPRRNGFTAKLPNGRKVRVWKRIGSLTYNGVGKIHDPDLDCDIVEPYAVLEHLPLSPNFQWLYEMRALLAIVLYADDMTDDDLRLCRTHVRG